MPLATHSFSKEEIMAYLDGELPAERTVAVAQHLEACEECQDQVSDFQGLSGHLATWTIAAGSSEAPRLEIERKSPKPSFWRRPWLLISATAAIIVVVGIAVRPRQQVTIAKYDQVQSGPRSEAAMSDGLTAGPSRRSWQSLAKSARFAIPLAAAASNPATGPLIVKTAQLNLISKDFERIRTEVERITTAHQGYLAQLQLSTTAGESRSLNTTLHIPAAQLDSALVELRRLGHLNSESQGGEDVTQRYVDLDARLANLRITEQRLQQILRDRTGRLSDVLEVEEAVDKTRGEIDTAVAEQKTLSTQIAFATVQVTVSEEYKAHVDGNSTSVLTRLHNAAVEGYKSAVESLISTLAFFLSIGPTVLILIVVGFFPARWVWRRRRATVSNSF